jgi:Protein of unknown function (DUF1822)
MNTYQPNISKLTEIYSEHDWIDLTAYPDWPIDENTTPVDLNLQCQQIVKEWLATDMGLASKEDFPYSGLPDRDRLVSQLVNGFCLKINDSKLIFIPSDRIDISSFEVAQEWVDLTNWMGDYYVPIQVDIDAQYLHLWGLITHQELKRTKEPTDRVFRYYHVDSDRTIDNLEILWTSCELSPAPRSKNITAGESICSLENGIVTELIDRIKSEASINFPRLILPFSQWGAILNNPEYLQTYLKPSEEPIKALIDEKICKSLADIFKGVFPLWETIEYFIDRPQPQMAFRGEYPQLYQTIDRGNYRGIPLETTAQIDIAIGQLYSSQNEIAKPDRILGIDDLLLLMKQSTQEHIRWQTAEYLWKIDPYHPKLPVRRMRDLGMNFGGHQIALMIGQMATPDDRNAILLRLYPLGAAAYLPEELKLTLLDRDGQPCPDLANKPFQAISRSYPRDQYIQLYFVAERGDHFGASITLTANQTIEQFIV